MQRGFTLVEFLIVIAVIGILSVVVIIVLNPYQLLAQARDSNRVSDLASLRSGVSLFQIDSPATPLGTPGTCYVSLPVTTFWTPDKTGAWATTSTCAAWFASAGATVATSAVPVVNNGGGWIPLNFRSITGGAPFGTEPMDPVNTAGSGASQSNGAFFYSFISSGGATNMFKLAAFMESVKRSNGGSGDVESVDGGSNNYVFEQGTDMKL